MRGLPICAKYLGQFKTTGWCTSWEELEGRKTHIQNFEGDPVDAVEDDKDSEEPPGVR